MLYLQRLLYIAKVSISRHIVLHRLQITFRLAKMYVLRMGMIHVCFNFLKRSIRIKNVILCFKPRPLAKCVPNGKLLDHCVLREMF